MINFKPGQFYGAPQFGARGANFATRAFAPTGSEHDVHLHTHDDAHFILVLSGLYISTARGAVDFVRAPALIFNPPGTTHRDRARAAGSMSTTIQDLSRFIAALLADKILQPSAKASMFTPQITIRAAHQFPTFDSAISDEGPHVGLAYGLGWGLLTRTPYGSAFFKEGHGDGAENYLICFTSTGTCMILLTNSDNGELAFRPLLEQLIGDTVTPWEWESYTRAAILQNEEHSPPK